MEICKDYKYYFITGASIAIITGGLIFFYYRTSPDDTDGTHDSTNDRTNDSTNDSTSDSTNDITNDITNDPDAVNYNETIDYEIVE